MKTIVSFMALLFLVGVGYSYTQTSFILNVTDPAFRYTENALNDGSTTMKINFSTSEDKTIFTFPIPKNSTIINSSITFRGTKFPYKTTLTDPTDDVYGLYVDDKWVYVGSDDDKVYVYNRTTFSLNKTLTNAESDVVSLVSDSDYLYAGSGWTGLYIWKLSDWSLNDTLTDDTGTLWDVFVDDDFIYAASGSHNITIWNKTTHAVNGTLDMEQQSRAVYADANYIYGGNDNGKVKIFNRNDFSLNTTIDVTGSETITDLYVDDNYLYVMSQFVRIYNKTNWNLYAKLSANVETTYGYAVKTDGDYIIVGKTYIPRVLIFNASDFGFYHNLSAEMHGVAIDSNNNIIVTGKHDLGDGSGGYEIYTKKYDKLGNLLWTRTYTTTTTGNEVDEGNGVAVDSNNNIIVVGRINDNNYTTIKYDSSGNQLWNRTFYYGVGGSGDFADRATSVAIDSQDNIIVTGFVNTDAPEYMTIKYDSSGNQLWNRTFKTDAWYHFAYGVAIDSQDNIIVAGQSRESGGYDEAHIIKYDSDGNELWNKHTHFSDSNPASFYDVATDSHDNIIAVGKAPMGPVEAPYDYLVVKFDSDGNQLWNWTKDVDYFEENDEVHGVVIDADDNIIVTGGTKNTYGYVLTDAYKFAENGTYLSSTNYGNGADTTTYDIALSDDEDFTAIVTTDGVGKYAEDLEAFYEPTAKIYNAYIYEDYFYASSADTNVYVYGRNNHVLNPTLDIGGDGTDEWTYSNNFTTTATVSNNSAFQSVLDSCGTPKCNVSLVFHSDHESQIVLTNLNITYDYHTTSYTYYWEQDPLTDINVTYNISYPAPQNNVTIRYIDVDDSATSATFNGTSCSLTTVDGNKVCDCDDFNVLPGETPDNTLFWDNTNIIKKTILQILTPSYSVVNGSDLTKKYEFRLNNTDNVDYSNIFVNVDSDSANGWTNQTAVNFYKNLNSGQIYDFWVNWTSPAPTETSYSLITETSRRRKYLGNLNVPTNASKELEIKYPIPLSRATSFDKRLATEITVDGYTIGPYGGQATYEVTDSTINIYIPTTFYGYSLDEGTHQVGLTYSFGTNPGGGSGGANPMAGVIFDISENEIEMPMRAGEEREIQLEIENKGSSSIYPTLWTLSPYIDLPQITAGILKPGEKKSVTIKIISPSDIGKCNPYCLADLRVMYGTYYKDLKIRIKPLTAEMLGTPHPGIVIKIAWEDLKALEKKIYGLRSKGFDTSTAEYYYQLSVREFKAGNELGTSQAYNLAIKSLESAKPKPFYIKIIDIIMNFFSKVCGLVR